MATDKRGVMQIKTMGGLVDSRRSRTSAGALLELSMLEMEKQRLAKEMERTERRCGEIRIRMTEIQTKQTRLQKFVDQPYGGIQVNQALEAALPFPIHSASPEKIKRRALTY